MYKALLLLLLAMTGHAQGVALAWSAQTYTSTWIRKEPWCSAWNQFTPTSFYMEHLMTQTESWSYGVGLPQSPSIMEKDEQYYYNNATERQLLYRAWMQDTWTYPNFNQAPSQAVRVHASNNGSGNYTDNNSDNKVNPYYRQAHVNRGYPDQGCGGYGGAETILVDGREYMIVANGVPSSLFRIWIHLETGLDAVTGFHYAGNFFQIKTVDGAGFKGTTMTFNASGDASALVYGGTLYDVTPSFKDLRGQYDFTYTVTGTSVVEK